MNINPVGVISVHKSKTTKKHKKSKTSKNELLNLSAKSSKTLLKAIQVAKEEANYFKKYYLLNLKNENIENEDNNFNSLQLTSHYQQQFLQTLLKQNNKNHHNKNVFVQESTPMIHSHSYSNLFPSTTIPPKHYYLPQQQIYQQIYPSQMNNCVENKNLNEYSHKIYNINIPNREYTVSNANFPHNELDSDRHPILRHNQLNTFVSSNENNNNKNDYIYVNNKNQLSANHNNSQYRYNNDIIPPTKNSCTKNFNKQQPSKFNNNIREYGVSKRNITINENNNVNKIYYNKTKNLQNEKTLDNNNEGIIFI